MFKWGALFKVRDGLNCRFWQDCWLLIVPLKVAYDDLFSLVRDPESVVVDHWMDEEWTIDFKRSLSIRGNLTGGLSSRESLTMLA